MWYEEFNLKENPFAMADRSTEMVYGKIYDSVHTKSVDLVETLIESKTSAIIVGPRGCGKSTTLKIAEGMFGCPTVIGPPTMKELCSLLLARTYEVTDRDKTLAELDAEYQSERLNWVRTWTTKMPSGISFTKWLCQFDWCSRKHRCEFPMQGKEDRTFKVIVEHLPSHIVCPYLQWIVARCYRHTREEYGKAFLLDVHDDIQETGPKYFRNFIQDLRENSKGVVILMATNEQYKCLLSTEYFRRWAKRDFPILGTEELRKIYKARLMEKNDPLTEDALNFVIVSSGYNPRSMIKNVSSVLEKMWGEKRKSPADLDYVMQIFEEKSKYLSEDEALNAVLKELGTCGVTWIKVKAIQEKMEASYGVNISACRLGRKLSQKGFDQRNNPDSEYKLRNG